MAFETAMKLASLTCKAITPLMAAEITLSGRLDYDDSMPLPDLIEEDPMPDDCAYKMDMGPVEKLDCQLPYPEVHDQFDIHPGDAGKINHIMEREAIATENDNLFAQELQPGSLLPPAGDAGEDAATSRALTVDECHQLGLENLEDDSPQKEMKIAQFESALETLWVTIAGTDNLTKVLVDMNKLLPQFRVHEGHLRKPLQTSRALRSPNIGIQWSKCLAMQRQVLGLQNLERTSNLSMWFKAGAKAMKDT